MSNLNDVFALDAVGQAALMLQREISREELLEATLARARALNPEIGAITALSSDLTLTDDRVEEVDKPFAGVPTIVKDLMAVKGMPLTFGSRAYRGNVANASSVVVERMRQAGFLIIGKSATSEFGLSPIGSSVLNGPCKCPWNTEYDAGGSSGGAAAAVASGMVAIAQGGDGGGSLRIPASVNGLIALKPSRGLMPQVPAAMVDGLLSHGAIGKSVRDIAMFMQSVSGNAPGDRWRAPPVDFSRFKDGKRTGWPRLRVGYLQRGFFGNIRDTETIDLVHASAQRLVEEGNLVEEVDLNWNREEFQCNVLDLFSLSALQCCLNYGMPPDDVRAPSYFEKWTLDLALRALDASPVFYVEVWDRLQPIISDYGKLLSQYDIVLAPMLAKPALRIGEIADTTGYLDFIDGAPLPNLLGNPAMSVPVGRSSANVPVGAHLMADWTQDMNLLAVAHDLTKAEPILPVCLSVNG